MVFTDKYFEFKLLYFLLLLVNAYILGNFIKARAIFMSTVDVVPPEYKNWYKYFFENEEIFAVGGAPNDRGCRICGKIGHIAKTCPVVHNRKAKQM